MRYIKAMQYSVLYVVGVIVLSYLAAYYEAPFYTYEKYRSFLYRTIGLAWWCGMAATIILNNRMVVHRYGHLLMTALLFFGPYILGWRLAHVYDESLYFYVGMLASSFFISLRVLAHQERERRHELIRNSVRQVTHRKSRSDS